MTNVYSSQVLVCIFLIGLVFVWVLIANSSWLPGFVVVLCFKLFCVLQLQMYLSSNDINCFFFFFFFFFFFGCKNIHFLKTLHALCYIIC